MSGFQEIEPGLYRVTGMKRSAVTNRYVPDTTLYSDVRMSVLKAVQEHYPALLYHEALEIAEAAARKADSGARLAYLAATS